MMKKGEFRIAIVILTVIFTVAILFGGYSAYKVYAIEKPVKAQLSSLQSVSHVTVDKEKKTYGISMKLESVDNLQSVYNHIEKVLNQRFAEDAYDLQIIDNRNEKLDDFYAKLQPVIQQAAAQSEFVWLDEQLSKKGSEMQLVYDLWVDEQRIYIQIHDGEHYLYVIINRSDINSNSITR
ncbi:MAG: hypothetical protein WAO72_04135 [Syntrophomonadaceae bacterium]